MCRVCAVFSPLIPLGLCWMVPFCIVWKAFASFIYRCAGHYLICLILCCFVLDCGQQGLCPPHGSVYCRVSRSSFCRWFDMYVISLSIHGVLSPVRTYCRCIRDSWSTCLCRIGMLPWYIANNDVMSMCNARVQPSVRLGVLGNVIVGVSVRREFGRLPVSYQALRWVCRLYSMGGFASDMPS